MNYQVLFPLSAGLLVAAVLTLFIGVNNFTASAWTWAQIIMLSLFVGYVCHLDDKL